MGNRSHINKMRESCYAVVGKKYGMELSKRDKLDIVKTSQIASEAVNAIIANPKLLNNMEIRAEMLDIINKDPFRLADLIVDATCKKPTKRRKQTFAGIMTSKVKPDKPPYPRPRLSEG